MLLEIVPACECPLRMWSTNAKSANGLELSSFDFIVYINAA